VPRGCWPVTQRALAFAGWFVWELARPPYRLLIVFLIDAFAAQRLRLLREQHRAER
jgi:hypothetical protein